MAENNKEGNLKRSKAKLIYILLYCIIFYIACYYMVPAGEKALFFCGLCLGGFGIPWIPYFAEDKYGDTWKIKLLKLVFLLPIVLLILYFYKLNLIESHNYIIPNSRGIKYKVAADWKITENKYVGDDFSHFIYCESKEERIKYATYYKAAYGDVIDLSLRAREDDEYDDSEFAYVDVEFPVTINFGKAQTLSKDIKLYAKTDLNYEGEELIESGEDYEPEDYGSATVNCKVSIIRAFDFFEVLFASTDYSGIKIPSQNKETQIDNLQDNKNDPPIVSTVDTSSDDEFDYRFIPMHDVSSSAISELGYSEDYEVLLVRFLNSGTLYAYYDVPYDEYLNLNNAESIGSYYNKYIKGTYDCDRLEN